MPWPLAEMVPNMDVGMPADIFGGGLHADIDAELERTMIERRGPGVVVDDQARHAGAQRWRWPEDRASRRFASPAASISTARVLGLKQAFDCRADQRVVIGDLDVKAGEEAHRRNCAWADTHCRRPGGWSPAFNNREQGGRNRAKSQTAARPAPATLRAPSSAISVACSALVVGGAVSAILELAAMGVQIPGRRIKHGRAAPRRED